MTQDNTALMSPENALQWLRKATTGPMYKIEQRFTALTLATAPLTVKKLDLNWSKQCELLISFVG